ncbi:hypothetical protein BDP27DRAFT_1327039 [Rhodocollybia butyracea]|uniref:Transcription factor CBF/NF-Y/archaeal histone domain-containing protein n=1 Tax=Rhodocollybia butyracea TaxID=206335 RepID=A0A9P5PSL6_9AGAR|nr:hypothetical protein BDP27DRAFT_1327039 [Rhodocollybia butyracea]
MASEPAHKEMQDIAENEVEYPNNPQDVVTGPKKKREKKETAPFIRDSGKSLLPFSRVQKIIKADKDIPIIARDATFLISLAAEEFIKRLCQAGKRVAEKERRTTVQHKDIATVVRKADEFMFLDEIISLTQPEPPQKRLPKALTVSNTTLAGPTLLDSFVKANDSKPQIVPEQTQNIVMNDDGSMVAATR